MLAFPLIPQPSISWPLMISLVLILIASVAVFWTLEYRATTARQWVALCEWARGRRFRVRREGDLLAPLDALGSPAPRVVRSILNNKARLAILQLAPVASDQSEARWNVLIRNLPNSWPPTGLRPVSAPRSALDLFTLSNFPLLTATDRFTVFGNDPAAAKSLAAGSAAALLPPDIGLLLHGSTLMLDFSDRPFDTIEFDRMIAVVEQIVTHLPEVRRA